MWWIKEYGKYTQEKYKVNLCSDISVSIKTKKYQELLGNAAGNVKWYSYCTKHPDGSSVANME